MFRIIQSQNVWSCTRKQIYYIIEMWPQPIPQSTSSLERQLKKGWNRGCIIYPTSVEDVRSSDLTKTARQVYVWGGNLIWIFQIPLWCLIRKTLLHSMHILFIPDTANYKAWFFKKKKAWSFWGATNHLWKSDLPGRAKAESEKSVSIYICNAFGKSTQNSCFNDLLPR